MTTRTSSKTVTFGHPFKLSGADEVQPAGRYVVETDEELIESLSRPAYRWLSTFIRLPGRLGSTELARVVDLDPAELAAALASDAEAPEAAPPPADRRVPGTQEKNSGAMTFVMNGWKRWLALNVTELTWTALLVGSMALAGLFA
ncbi:MAG: hypothetical protein ACLQJR_18635 [Stellaceae bacterium]